MKKQYYLGCFFLFLQIVAIVRNYLLEYNYFFWFCDFVPLLFSIAFFVGNKDIIKSIISFGLIPQAVFLIDFIYTANLGISPLGITEHLIKFNSFAILSTIFIHLTTIIALLFTFKIKPDRNTLLYSILFMFGVYLVTLVFTSPNEDINFVYSTGNLLKSSNITIPYIVLTWPILTFLFIVLPGWWIQQILYKFFKKEFRPKNLAKPKTRIKLEVWNHTAQTYILGHL